MSTVGATHKAGCVGHRASAQHSFGVVRIGLLPGSAEQEVSAQASSLCDHAAATECDLHCCCLFHMLPTGLSKQEVEADGVHMLAAFRDILQFVDSKTEAGQTAAVVVHNGFQKESIQQVE